MHYRKYIFIIISALIFLSASTSLGYFLGYDHERGILDSKFNAIHPVRINSADYKFINPLLMYVIPSADEQWGLTDIKQKVQTAIDANKKSGLSDASVFFQDLNHGRWMGINQNDQYNPASMLKVVIMVSYYKKAESDNGFLHEKLLYTSNVENTIHQNPYNQLSSLVVGKSYAIDDLIKKMIVDSDNGAAQLLLNNISQSSLNSVYDALNIQSPDEVKGDFTISPRYYSFFFRILYSATYLSDTYSEKALDILSDATFKEGIVSGVPSDVLVAHKYGEYVLQQNNQVYQIELHDCGIVYYPNNPYLLCIMTKGDNLDALKSTIKNISSAVYQNYGSLKY